jgi:hypothetical protein
MGHPGLPSQRKTRLPLLNTSVLLASGLSITWAHHSLMEGNWKNIIQALSITILLGIYFTLLQALEYFQAWCGLPASRNPPPPHFTSSSSIATLTSVYDCAYIPLSGQPLFPTLQYHIFSSRTCYTVIFHHSDNRLIPPSPPSEYSSLRTETMFIFIHHLSLFIWHIEINNFW